MPGVGSSPKTPAYGGEEKESSGVSDGGYIVEKEFVYFLKHRWHLSLLKF